MNQPLCLVNFEHPYSDSTDSKQATATTSHVKSKILEFNIINKANLQPYSKHKSQSAWCSRFYYISEQMLLTVHAHILRSFMGRPGLQGTSCFMRRSSISVMKLLCSGYTGSKKDVYSPIPQATADKLLTDYEPLNDVSSHLTCTI